MSSSTPFFASYQRCAFTLVELLVVLGIVAVLAALILPVVGQVRRQADRTAALAQMHQIAVALAAYTGEHDGKLPGPMFPGQMPMLDPGREGRLVLSLAPYLGVPIPSAPQLVPLFIPPAYKRAVSATFLNDARTYVLNMAVPLPGGGNINPWGNAATSTGQPVSLAIVPAQAWAFTDADQQNPRVIGTPWQANTPAKAIHAPRRLVVRFDGSAGEIADAELVMPPS